MTDYETVRVWRPYRLSDQPVHTVERPPPPPDPWPVNTVLIDDANTVYAKISDWAVVAWMMAGNEMPIDWEDFYDVAGLTEMVRKS